MQHQLICYDKPAWRHFSDDKQCTAYQPYLNGDSSLPGITRAGSMGIISASHNDFLHEAPQLRVAGNIQSIYIIRLCFKVERLFRFHFYGIYCRNSYLHTFFHAPS